MRNNWTVKTHFTRSVTRSLMISLVCFLWDSSEAATIHVPADQPTIQDGIDSASNGDTVLVVNGTYKGIGNRDIDFKGKAIAVISENGPLFTTIDCEGTQTNQHRGFIFENGEDASSVLEGITILNGYGPIILGVSRGGGVVCVNSSSPRIINCVFESNQSVQDGGAVFIHSSSSPYFENCSFRDNTSARGGGIYCECLTCSPTFVGCTFVGNSGTFGGGAFVHSSASLFTNCLFHDNSGGNGGGIWAGSGSQFDECTIVGNSGSGIYSSGGVAVLSNSIIAFNGSVAVEGELATFDCCNIYGNSGGDWVGDIANQASLFGNISANPFFCDTGSNNFGIYYYSSCAPSNNSCSSLIGAYPVSCCCTVPGDADDGGDTNIGDATFIVKYIFQGGDAPPCLDQANADGGADVNIGDATYIVKFIFQSGDFPVCGTTGS